MDTDLSWLRDELQREHVSKPLNTGKKPHLEFSHDEITHKQPHDDGMVLEITTKRLKRFSSYITHEYFNVRIIYRVGASEATYRLLEHEINISAGETITRLLFKAVEERD